MTETPPSPLRRCLLGAALGGAGFWIGAAHAQTAVHDLRIGRDAGCGCCHAWTEIIRSTGRFRTTLVNEPNMVALKRRLGVPGDLASCHTGVVEGLVVEGHVPAVDMLRLLEARPRGVLGLAVAGMPLGSPGMEQGAARRAFDVVAFRADAHRDVFAHYSARS
jgi:hypothetical protein